MVLINFSFECVAVIEFSFLFCVIVEFVSTIRKIVRSFVFKKILFGNSSKFLAMFELYFLEDQTSYEQLHATLFAHYHRVQTTEVRELPNFVPQVFKFGILEDGEKILPIDFEIDSHGYYSVLSIAVYYSTLSSRNQRLIG